MPNASSRYKLLLTRILSVTAKTFDFAAVPGMGFFAPVLGQIAAQCRCQLIAPNARPKPYVTAASITPTIVISNPDAHHERSVISDFTAPTAKCATMLIAKAQTTAAIPLMKKKGTIGMNAPTAVEIPAEAKEFPGDGKRCSESPSSLCAIACTS